MEVHQPGIHRRFSIGIKSRSHGITPHGGNMPQLLVNKLALEIQRGELDIAIIAGGEASNSCSCAP